MRERVAPKALPPNVHGGSGLVVTSCTKGTYRRASSAKGEGRVAVPDPVMLHYGTGKLHAAAVGGAHSVGLECGALTVERELVAAGGVSNLATEGAVRDVLVCGASAAPAGAAYFASCRVARCWRHRYPGVRRGSIAGAASASGLFEPGAEALRLAISEGGRGCGHGPTEAKSEHQKEEHSKQSTEDVRSALRAHRGSMESLQRAIAAGSRTACVEAGRAVSYSSLMASARRLASSLAQLLHDRAHGGRVALLANSGTEYACGTYATWLTGSIAVPLAPSHPAHEAEHVLRDASASAVRLLARNPPHVLLNRLSLTRPSPAGPAGACNCRSCRFCISARSARQRPCSPHHLCSQR